VELHPETVGRINVDDASAVMSAGVNEFDVPAEISRALAPLGH